MSRGRPGRWLFSARPAVTTISPDRDTVYSFDLEGRPLSWFEHGRVFKRSLGSEVHGRERKDGARRRWIAPPPEARRHFARLLRRLADAPRSGLDGEVQQRLDRALRWTPEALLAERQRFDATYRPIGILPPDQYLAVVLQATLGCSWNRCTFCSFYQDRPFVVRSADEFRRHTEAVVRLLGRGERLRRRIFLADGNALVLANERLRALLDVASRRFPGRAFYGFVDVFSGERTKSAEEWAELRRLGLERVYIGVETGHDPLLRWMNKPGCAADARAFVGTLKRAGLLVSTILMVGVGGSRYAAAHVSDTLQLLSSLALGRGDIVYLSPFVEQPGSAYAGNAAAEGVLALDDRERDEQYATLRDGIRAACPARVTRYDIREFVY